MNEATIAFFVSILNSLSQIYRSRSSLRAKIPVVFCGGIVFKSVSGLHEEYQFSNPGLGRRFVNARGAFQNHSRQLVFPKLTDRAILYSQVE